MSMIQPGSYSAELLARKTVPVAVQKIDQDSKQDLASQLLSTLPPPNKPGQGTVIDPRREETIASSPSDNPRPARSSGDRSMLADIRIGESNPFD